jgi:hypothetical protein
MKVRNCDYPPLRLRTGEEEGPSAVADGLSGAVRRASDAGLLVAAYGVTKRQRSRQSRPETTAV